MDENNTKTELTDEEIASANTQIILSDSEGTQLLDSANQENILANLAERRNKDCKSNDRQTDSQSTCASNDSLINNADENSSFILSDMSDELNSLSNSQSQQQTDGNAVVMKSSSCSNGRITNNSIGSSDISPIDERRFPSSPCLSSTPFLRRTTNRMRTKTVSKKKDNVNEVSPTDVVSSFPPVTPKRKNRLQHSGESDQFEVPAKRFRSIDEAHYLSQEDNKDRPIKIQEHVFTMVGSVKFVIDESNNTIYSATLKQLSLADDFGDSSSGVVLIPSDTDCATRHRLSIGSGSDSSGNLADRSFTASSVSVPGPFELPRPQSTTSNKGGSSSTNHRDSFTSTSSSLTSVSRQLDMWYARHHLNDNQARSSILKLWRSQRIHLSCEECNHMFPSVEVPSVVDCAVRSNVTPETLSENFNEAKSSLNSSGGTKHKAPVIDYKMDSEDDGLKSKQTYLNKDCIKHDLSPSRTQRTINSPFMQSENIPKHKDGSNSNNDYRSNKSSKSHIYDTNETENIEPLPCSSGMDEHFAVVKVSKCGNTSSSTINSSSDCDGPSLVFDAPFIEKEDLPEGDRGKIGPRHPRKRTKTLTTVEEETTSIVLSNGREVKYPPSDCRLFENCNFLFTYSRVDCEKYKRKCNYSMKSLSLSELDDISSSGEIEIVETTPSELMALVKYGGGNVYRSLHEIQLPEWCNTYLISNRPCRTIKYLRCLANGIPRYCQSSILECCSEKVPFKQYVVSNDCQQYTGWSEEIGRYIRKQKFEDPLKGCTVLLALDRSIHCVEEIGFWVELLTCVGASVKKLKRNQEEISLDSVNIIVTDNNCSDKLIEEARKTSKPVVGCNWIIHTLIHGKFCDPNASPTYKHTYVPDY